MLCHGGVRFKCSGEKKKVKMSYVETKSKHGYGSMDLGKVACQKSIILTYISDGSG
ncbi:hypothetical protein Hdeb2414_s0005g00169061 [Helianthus debilis subsp. tardiflorus]